MVGTVPVVAVAVRAMSVSAIAIRAVSMPIPAPGTSEYPAAMGAKASACVKRDRGAAGVSTAAECVRSVNLGTDWKCEKET